MFKKNSLSKKLFDHECKKIKEIITKQTRADKNFKYKFDSSHTCSIQREHKSSVLKSDLCRLVSSFEDTKKLIFEEFKEELIKKSIHQRVHSAIREFKCITKHFIKFFDFEDFETNAEPGCCLDDTCIQYGECEYVTGFGEALCHFERNEELRHIVENFLSVLVNKSIQIVSTFNDESNHQEFKLASQS